MRLDLSAWLASRHGDRVALTEGSRGTSLTFEELDGRALRAAASLTQHGVRAGDRVSVLSGPDPATVVLFFGAVKLGATVVPHNLRLTPSELSLELSRVRPSLIVKQRAIPSGSVEGGAGSPPVVLLESLTTPEGDVPALPREALRDWEAPALILFTGGSTGPPKGALLSLRALVSNAINTSVSWQLTREDSTVLVFPLFHTGGWNVLLLPLLMAGGRSILLPKFHPAEVLHQVDRERVTVLSGVPSMLIDIVAHPDFARASLRSLRWVKSGGGNSPRGVVEAFRARGIPFYQGYGLTEAGPNLLYSATEDLSRPGSIGRPNFLSELVLVDEHGGESSEGELWVRGPVLFSGYLDDPRATAEAMHGEYVRTGDVLRRDADGFYYFVGRTKLMFKSGGENVYIGEVEQVLEAHPAVAEAAVIGMPDPRWGEVGRAYVVLRDPLSDEELRAHVRGRLASFKVPKSFVRVPELPHTRAGKKDYPALIERVGG